MQYCPDDDGSCSKADRDIRELLDDLENMPSAQRWTPVSEGLPKANGRYYVTRGLNACGALWNRVYIVNYSDLMEIKVLRQVWFQSRYYRYRSLRT